VNQLVIYGQGDFAKLMYKYFTDDSDIEVVAFCVDSNFREGNIFCELPMVNFDSINEIYPPAIYNIFIAIGYSNMRNRIHMYEKVKEKGYSCINYISSSANVDNTLIIGENNVIMQNVVIEPFVEIGNNNIIWSSCNICHNVTMTSHSFVAAQALIGGFVKINDNCFLGFNSTIIQNLVLADETLLATKSLLLKNTEKCSKYIGIPAKKVSEHIEKGIFV